ncbi:hypothetical protein EFN43_08485 [Pediococcus pentosaceus]|uniref:hypothetical protein n=1 Tax=Pediococcus pentosaceus TaxID=1255 RepID=UPI0021A576A9|nr:hypothetical protein [Pediococcus pentosaceus]MCT3021093.1 hypothetical protein [Pediococcus pentosaceus]
MAKEEKVDFNSEIVFSVPQVANLFHKRVGAINTMIDMGLLKGTKWGEKKVDRWSIIEFWEKHAGEDIDELVKEWEIGKQENARKILAL